MPKRCGTLDRCSLGVGRDVTLTSFPAMWVSGLMVAGGGGRWELMNLWRTGLGGLVRLRVLSAPLLCLASVGVGRQCGCHLSPGK